MVKKLRGQSGIQENQISLFELLINFAKMLANIDIEYKSTDDELELI